MPSFDVVSEVDMHELDNAIDQANREVANRYDFKGSEAKFEIKEQSSIRLDADSDFQVKQMLDVLYGKLSKRGLDLGNFKAGEPQPSGKRCFMLIEIKQGIDKDIAKKIVKSIKESKMKVQGSVQGEQVRITGKKRDDLQSAIALLKSQDFNLPLQFTNFRD